MKLGAVLAGTIFAFVLITSVAIPAYAEYLSPKKQLESGVLPEDIQCKKNKILAIRDNGKMACVSPSTAEKKLWNIIQTEFMPEMIPSEKDTIDTPIESTTITLNVASDTEFADDKREIKRSILQRAPAPWPIYDKIINSTTGLIVPGPSGALGMQTTPHEKYSLNHKVGLYLEDWMPTHIPEGQKLLYADTDYNAFEVNGRDYESHNAIYQFVPTSFVLKQGVNSHDLKVSQGFTVNIKHRTLPFDSVEDGIEYLKEIDEIQPGSYGSYRDMTRDGKTVSAYEGGNLYNHYQATVYFQPDENTSIGVHSYYHTLDELIPVFNSIMK